MRHLTKGIAALAVVSLALFASACNKAPAQAALTAADQALAAATPEIEKYVPEQLGSLTTAVQAARSEFEKGFRDEHCDILQILVLDDHHQVETAGHQVTGLDLRITEDPGGNAVEALVALRCHTDFDQCGHRIAVGLFPVDDGIVCQDDLAFFHALDVAFDLLDRTAGHDGNLSCRQLGVLFEQAQDLFFAAHMVSSVFWHQLTIRQLA